MCTIAQRLNGPQRECFKRCIEHSSRFFSATDNTQSNVPCLCFWHGTCMMICIAQQIHYVTVKEVSCHHGSLRFWKIAGLTQNEDAQMARHSESNPHSGSWKTGWNLSLSLPITFGGKSHMNGYLYIPDRSELFYPIIKDYNFLKENK